jgi:endogenous inhibitor of DNA gyrase (YacG/DUF329 family)
VPGKGSNLYIPARDVIVYEGSITKRFPPRSIRFFVCPSCAEQKHLGRYFGVDNTHAHIVAYKSPAESSGTCRQCYSHSSLFGPYCSLTCAAIDLGEEYMISLEAEASSYFEMLTGDVAADLAAAEMIDNFGADRLSQDDPSCIVVHEFEGYGGRKIEVPIVVIANTERSYIRDLVPYLFSSNKTFQHVLDNE